MKISKKKNDEKQNDFELKLNATIDDNFTIQCN